MGQQSLLPPGITIGEGGAIEINFRVADRDGILQLRRSGLISAEQAQEWLQKQREVAAKPTSFGGKVLDTIRAAFDPTDPRGVRKVGPIPVKTGLFAAGITPLAVTAAAALPTAATTIGAAAGAREALRGVAGPVARRPLRSVGVAALGAGAALGTGAILRSDEPGTAPPPEAAPEEEPSGVEAAIAGLLEQTGGDVDTANKVLEERGSSTRLQKSRELRFIPGRGVVEVDVFTPFLQETVLDAEGNPVQIETPGESFVPELNEARFNQQERIRREGLRAEQQQSALASLPALTQFFSMLADPRTANLLRIASARAQGLPTVPGFNLPDQLGAIFGLQEGQAFPSGITGQAPPGVEDTQGVIRGDISPLGGGGRELASKRTNVIAGLPSSEREAAAGGPGGFLGILDTLLGAGGFSPIGLQSQITPGSLQSFGPDVIGALEAGLIGSGTSLQEQRRQARRSALPGGASVGIR